MMSRPLHTVVFAGLIAAATGLAQAQNWPARPVRIVVGFSPGSTTDATARLLASRLAEIWKQPVVIENRSGAGSSVASAMVAKATPDGYTLMVVSASFAINAVLRGASAGYDPLRDFVSVAQVGTTTGALVVTPGLGVKSVKELIAVVRERPGKIFYGSSGAGSGLHITAERFNMVAGIKVTHVAFKGQPEMLIEILAGRVHYGFPGLGPSLGMIKDGRLTALAVVTDRRSPLLPEVPALVEILPTFRRDAAHTVMAPAGTPKAIVDRIGADVVRVVNMPDVRAQMQAIDFMPAPEGPAEADRILRAQLTTFAEVAKAVGLK
jgi:tripartite-type tricarboxylate transporter receptor subunit TctC